MSPPIRRPLLALALLLLAGCAARPVAPVLQAPETPVQAQQRRTQASRPTYNLSGYPPAVREGYIDGCESAKRTQYGRKDAKRFADDAQYQMGWNDGFGICKPK
jgi:outer membrane biogenesis lipoprotein LolB